jgi:SAM-dependent methyltransferase
MYSENNRNSSLLRECLQSVRAHAALRNPLNKQLLQQVAGAGANENDYLYGGFGSSVGVRAALHSIGTSLYDCKQILDFGCGPARLLRWFGDVSPFATLHGCDLNAPAVEWCRANIEFAEFALNDAWPPLPYADGIFDLVYGVSVFTHLNESMQTAWLNELYRITKPGGIVLLTVHGEDKARSDVSPEEFEQFTADGFLYRKATVLETVDGLPSFYQVAFHSERYIRAAWADFFDLLGYITHGCMYAQDLVILRAKTAIRSKASNRPAISLPLAAFETPTIGSIVDQKSTDDFEVRGWVFRPDGELPAFTVWIDGQRVGSSRPSDQRPHVLSAFPMVAAAERSGFSLRLPSKGLTQGLHIMWLTLVHDETPLWATFFHCAKSPRIPFVTFSRWFRPKKV